MLNGTSSAWEHGREHYGDSSDLKSLYKKYVIELLSFDEPDFKKVKDRVETMTEALCEFMKAPAKAFVRDQSPLLNLARDTYGVGIRPKGTSAMIMDCAAARAERIHGLLTNLVQNWYQNDLRPYDLHNDMLIISPFDHWLANHFIAKAWYLYARALLWNGSGYGINPYRPFGVLIYEDALERMIHSRTDNKGALII